jgi:hypothetical protein
VKIMPSEPVHTGGWLRRACLLGVTAAFLAAPTAFADPADPVAPAPSPAPATDIGTQPTAVSPPPAPAPVQHLSSPDNLPPGTSADAPPPARWSYLRELLHAIRTQDVSGRDALLLLAQRPLDADAAPPPGMPAGPSGPIGTSAVPPAAEPAPAG